MIPPDQLADYLDYALDGPARESVERRLEQDPEALRFVLEQRKLDRVLGSLLAPAARRQRLKSSVLAAIAGPSTEHLRVQVLADTSGRPFRPAATKPPFARGWGSIRTLLDGMGVRFLSPGWARFAVAAAIFLLVVGAWFLIQPYSETQIVVGRFAVVVGQPTLQHGGSRSTSNPQLSTPIHFGDRLRTGDADKAELVFLDGTSLRLGFNTTLEIPQLPSPISNSRSPILRPPEILLRRGQVWTQLKKTTNAPPYAIRTVVATAIARGTEFGVKLQHSPSGTGSQSQVSTPNSQIPWLAVLTVKEGAVDFFNAFGSVQATAMTESSAQAGTAPTEPKRLQTLQVVRVDERTTWSLTTSPLGWPEAAEKLSGGGGSVTWQVRDVPLADGRQEVRVSQLPRTSPAAQAGFELGDVVLALDGRGVTNAAQVQSAILVRPGEAVTLHLRREAAEKTVSMAIPPGSSALRGPALSAESAGQLTALLRQWITAPAGPTVAATVETRQFEDVARLSRSNDLRAAAFNNLGVLFELGDVLGPAIRAYGRAVYLAPEIPLYRFNLGLALRKIGSFERALEEFEQAARLEPDSIPARKRVAEVQSLLGHHTEALALTEALLKSVPQDHGAWELKAQILLKLNRPAEAVAPARLAAELDPDCPVAHAYLAEAFHAAKQLTEAGAAYAETLDRAPFEAVFHMNHGTLQRDLGQLVAAEQSFRRAIELAPNFALAHRNLGEALANGRDSARASEAFQRARELNPGDATAHWRLGDMALKRRQFDVAERTYRDALKVSPNAADAFYGLGEVYRLQRRSADAEPRNGLGLIALDRGQVTDAERWLRQALAQEPDSPIYLNNLGDVLRMRGLLDEAGTLLRRALELDPNYLSPYGNLGIVHAMRREFGQAEAVFRTLLGRSTGNARLPVLVNLASVCGEQGKLDAAERLFRQALELAPDHPRVGSSLASFLADHQLKLDEALELANRAARTQPDNPEFLDALGWVQTQRGELEAAERTLRRALDRAGSEPPAEEIRAHLEKLSERQGTPPR